MRPSHLSQNCRSQSCYHSTNRTDMFAMYVSVHNTGNALLWLCWNVCLIYIHFINELGITGGDQKKVGYYAGK